MRHYVKGKDFRRIGGFFQDDTLEESTQENMTAAKNWKSVMTGNVIIIVRVIFILTFELRILKTI